MRGRVTQKVTSETSAATSIQKIIRAIPIGSDDGNRHRPPEAQGMRPQEGSSVADFYHARERREVAQGAFRLKY
jgi:hypothetical protein